MGVVRGCGTRVTGGIYAEVPLSKHGMPFEWFLRCPPNKVEANSLGVSPVGVKLIEVNGVWHIFDWIGKQHYKNVADFVEEAQRFGISRRLPKNLDFKKLTQESKLILMHERAWIDNFEQFEGTQHCPNECPKEIKNHNRDILPEMCIGLWWKDIEGGEETEWQPADKKYLKVVRKMPSFEYEGYARPDHIKREYSLAIFGAFPIPRLVVVNDPVDKAHEEAMRKAKAANLPVRLVDE